MSDFGFAPLDQQKVQDKAIIGHALTLAQIVLGANKRPPTLMCAWGARGVAVAAFIRDLTPEQVADKSRELKLIATAIDAYAVSFAAPALAKQPGVFPILTFSVTIERRDETGSVRRSITMFPMDQAGEGFELSIEPIFSGTYDSGPPIGSIVDGTPPTTESRFEAAAKLHGTASQVPREFLPAMN